MRQPLLARCTCGNRKVERPLCQGGPGARAWWTKRWPMPGGCPVQVVDRGEGGWHTGVHSTLLECMLVLWEAFQVLFCVLSSFNHSLMVVPPDPWICTLPHLHLQEQGWKPASQTQPEAAIYSRCVAQVGAVAERALSWGRGHRLGHLQGSDSLLAPGLLLSCCPGWVCDHTALASVSVQPAWSYGPEARGGVDLVLPHWGLYCSACLSVSP